MKRVLIAMQIKPEMKGELRKRLKTFRKSVLSSLKGVDNLSIWSVQSLAFCYAEASGKAALDEGRSLTMGLLNHLKDCCDCLASPMQNPMRLMYEDIGVIRADKSAIRHRVFVTRLKPFCADEYKRRHDNLTASRNGVVNPGPESNFTIWNTQDYIFGYCELDRSMEQPMSDQAKQAAIAWETRMLEIMDWLTDDVDWLTGIKHEKIELLFEQGPAA